ncbi:50S ribosomal protein L22, partial [bacterium]|nr:50S ribosomal protein L22 [bacterium]
HNGALILKKLVRSAVANVSHNLGVTNTDLLTVREIFVNEGRVGKRFQPKGRGRIYQILKRSCHVVLTVSNARGK